MQQNVSFDPDQVKIMILKLVQIEKLLKELGKNKKVKAVTKDIKSKKPRQTVSSGDV